MLEPAESLWVLVLTAVDALESPFGILKEAEGLELEFPQKCWEPLFMPPLDSPVTWAVSLEKKTDALAEERGEGMKEALAQLRAQVTPQVYAAMDRDLQGLMARELGSQAIDKLAGVQFLGLRLGVSVGNHGCHPNCWLWTRH
jgi:hypothetical protein